MNIIIEIDDDLSRYKVVTAPLLYMIKEGCDNRIRSYVKDGGIFVATYFSGIVDERDLVIGAYPGRLRDILGIWVEEQDALPEGEENHFKYDGSEYPAQILCDIIHTEEAECISRYQDDFYRDTPVITCNQYGEGKAWYIGTRSDRAFYRKLLSDICSVAGVRKIMKTPEGVEAAVRDTKKGKVLFLLNHTDEVKSVRLPDGYQEILTERIDQDEKKKESKIKAEINLKTEAGKKMEISGKEVAILYRKLPAAIFKE